MESHDRAELRAIVREALATHWDEPGAAEVIRAAHGGQLRGFVNHDNLHLFRQYRNRVTSNPMALVIEAKRGE